MAVNSTQRGLWRALLQRGLGTAAELPELLTRRLSAAADPRARLIRRAMAVALAAIAVWFALSTARPA